MACAQITVKIGTMVDFADDSQGNSSLGVHSGPVTSSWCRWGQWRIGPLRRSVAGMEM